MSSTNDLYLYGQLNDYVEYLTPEFISSDKTINVTQKDSNENKVDLSVNVERLVKLKQVALDSDPTDDKIKTYQLFGFNAKTNDFDIPLGDQIKIGESSNSETGSLNITSIKINNQVIKATVDETGVLSFEAIPSSAIVTTNMSLDGNGVGGVY